MYSACRHSVLFFTSPDCMDWVVVFCGVEDGVTSTDLINSQLVVNTQTQLEV